MIDSDGKIYWTVDPLIKVNQAITGSNIITLRKVNAKSYGLEELYMDKDLIQDKHYQIIDQSNERKMMSVKFHSILLKKMHPLFDGNVKSSNIC